MNNVCLFSFAQTKKADRLEQFAAGTLPIDALNYGEILTQLKVLGVPVAERKGKRDVRSQ